MNIAAKANDKGKEEEGVWLEYDGAKLLVASTSSKKYRKARAEALVKAAREKGVGKALEAEDFENVNYPVVAKTILLGWKDVKVGDQDFPYSEKNAEWVLRNCPDVYDFVYKSASENENFRMGAVEAAKAALGESSTGS